MLIDAAGFFCIYWKEDYYLMLMINDFEQYV